MFQLDLVTRMILGAHLRDHKRFDLASVRNMRTCAQIHHRSTAVHSGGCAIGDLCFDNVLLVLVVLQQYRRQYLYLSRRRGDNTHREHLKQRLLWHNETFKLLLFFDGAFRNFLEGGIIRSRDSPDVHEICNREHKLECYLSSMAIS